jgi:hypothetical protein
MFNGKKKQRLLEKKKATDGETKKTGFIELAFFLTLNRKIKTAKSRKLKRLGTRYF